MLKHIRNDIRKIKKKNQEKEMQRRKTKLSFKSDFT